MYEYENFFSLQNKLSFTDALSSSFVIVTCTYIFLYYVVFFSNMNLIAMMYSSFRLHGSYEALKYASSQDGLADLMGGIIESFNIRQDPTSCLRVLSRLLKTTSVTTCIVQQQTKVRYCSQTLSEIYNFLTVLCRVY